jgi:hypothetical protein
MTGRVTASFLVAALTVVGATSAIAAPPPVAAATSAGNQLVVKISKGQVQLAANGTVLVPLRARCQPPLGAFELDVSVRQDAVFGSVVRLGTNFPPCDGRWHQITVVVAPDAGSFVSGVATVDASLSAFDPVEGDLTVFDTVTVRL